ncbi:MAG: PilN domain-containing protein [Nitrospirota bacterium]
MKRSINLLADLALAAEPPPSPWRVLSVVGAALVIPVVVWGVHARAAGRLDPQVAELRTARERLVVEGDQVRRTVAELQEQIARRAAEQARAEAINWSEAFRELSLVVPRGMWLSDLGRSDAAGPGADAEAIAIRIRGVAVSQRVVADLLLNLETAAHFADPMVIYTQRGANLGIARVEFEVQCALRKGASGAPREREAA